MAACIADTATLASPTFSRPRALPVRYVLGEPFLPRFAVPLFESPRRNLAFDEQLRELPALCLALERDPVSLTARSFQCERGAGRTRLRKDEACRVFFVAFSF